MSTSTSLFSEDLSPHEQYIMFIGYLDAMHDSICKRAKSDRDMKVNHLIMSTLNQKVVETLFPNGEICQEEISHIGKQMNKLKMGDRVETMMDEVSQSIQHLNPEDLMKMKTKEDAVDLIRKIMTGGGDPDGV